jgi:integrase
MGVFKRGDWYWMDARVHGHRYREPLGTTDWREAKRLERERVDQLQTKASVPSAASLTYAAMDVSAAITAYADERRAQVSTRMRAYWLENARPLKTFFGDAKLRQIAPAQLAAYQNARTEAGRAPKTINGELSVLRQVLKRAKLWYRFDDDYTTLRNRKPPVGRALTAEEQSRLFDVARTKPAWLFACVAATLSFYCGLRACEIKALRWQDVELANRLLHVRRSKTPAGWRAPTLNATCLSVLQELHDTSNKLGFTQPTHFVFPWHGRNKQLDPTKAMTSWRSAWRSLRRAAGLTEVRFHDGRHTAITTLAEKGLPDWVIQAQVGHVAPEMMKTYSHIRRQALNQAADALEPASVVSAPPPQSPTPSQDTDSRPKRVWSHSRSQNDRDRGRLLDFPRKVGSSGWIRTSNPPVNSRMLCR